MENESDGTHRKKKDQEEEDEVEPFGEIMIHQFIETVEFSLGCISNTASYLRLWALSLAHQKLGEVAFEKLILMLIPTITGSNPVIPSMCGDNVYIYVPVAIVLFLIIWPMYCGAILGLVMGLDMLECYLHCLRLHWVEFQKKFYKGEGVKYIAYGFDMNAQDESEENQKL